MRVLPIALTAALVAGCGARTGHPVQLTATVAAPADQTFECVNHELGEMGYEVVTSDREDRVIEGARVDQPAWPLRLLGFRPTMDRISAAITDDELQVSAVSADAVPEPGEPVGPTTTGQRHAERLVVACGESN